MLHYCIENVIRVDGSPSFVRLSGWVVDTEGKSVEMKTDDHSGQGAALDLFRVARPDVAEIFQSGDKNLGFELEISCSDPANVDLILSHGQEKITLKLTEITPGMSTPQLDLKIPFKCKVKSFFKKCKLALLWVLFLPLRLLKIIKNHLFRICPPFQKFYHKYIYGIIHPEITGKNVVHPPAAEGSAWGEHLLLVSHFADGSGAPILALNIARTLHGFGFNVHTVLMRPGELHDSFLECGTVDVVHSEEEFRAKLQEWEKSWHIRKAFLNTTLPGIYASLLKEFGMQVINLVHEMPGTVAEMGQFEASSVLRTHADKIVLPSTLLIDLWKENNMPFPEDRCVILPQTDYHSDLCALNDEAQKQEAHKELCRELNIPEDSFIVMGCGTLETRKAPDVYFQSAFDVCKEDPRVHFIWIGDSGDAFYRRKIDLLVEKISGNARKLSYRKLNKYYLGADLFFLPSKEDPFPTVGLLAAKVAMPVIFCRRCTGLRDLFGDVAGCSSDEYSQKEFSSMILRFAADRKRCAEQGKLFQKIYQEKMYSFKQYVQSLYELAGDPLAKITAIVPNYNYASFLPARVKTVADQTYPIYELLILDDCSKDNSAEVAEQLIRQYRNHFPGGIRYIPNEQNAGVFRQWYKGVSLAQSDLIWIAEADDMCVDRMQSKLVHAFRDPKVKIAYAQSALIDGNDSIYSETFLQHTHYISDCKWTKDYISDASTEIETALAIKNTIPNASGALIRKEAFYQIPEELFTYRVIGDWFAYLHMILNGRVAFCAEPMNLYRRHPGSVVAKNPKLLLDELMKLNHYITSTFPISNYTKNQMVKEFNRTCLLLKSSLNDTVRETDPFVENRETAYWLLNENPDWDAFRDMIARSKAECLFISLEKKNMNLPPQVAESFAGPIHVFWHEELKDDLFRNKFVLWSSLSAAEVQ